MLDDLGLLPGLLWLFERYTGQTGVRVDFKQFGLEGQRFDAETETAAYRIVQEALTNVARHAGVRQVTVRAWAESDMLGVQIEDHGTGFDRPAIQLSGYSSGLAGMHERTSILGGQLSIETALGAGTRVTAILPLRCQEEGSSHARDDSPRR
jgi:signal transduction histidine kinase